MLQLEKVNLDQLKIETDVNLQKGKLESEAKLRQAKTKKRDTNPEIDKFWHKVEELNSKRTSVSLRKIELKKSGCQIIK